MKKPFSLKQICLVIAIAMFLLFSSVIQAKNGSGGCSDWEKVVAPDCKK
jgi:hypothetical protein